MRIFLDTSALAKRYIVEPGSDVVMAHCAQAHEIVMSTLCPIELLSTLNRLKREKKIHPSHYQKLKTEIASDLEYATVIDLTPGVVRSTIACLEHTSLAAMDAIHIASSQEAQCDLFLTADQKQYQAAKQLRIKSEYIHP